MNDHFVFRDCEIKIEFSLQYADLCELELYDSQISGCGTLTGGNFLRRVNGFINPNVMNFNIQRNTIINDGELIHINAYSSSSKFIFNDNVVINTANYTHHFHFIDFPEGQDFEIAGF